MPAAPSHSAGVVEHAPYRFGFVPRYGFALLLPLLLGLAIAGGLIYLNHRERDSLRHELIVIGIASLLLAGLVARRVMALRAYAASLGSIELDDEGARWQRRDGGVGFDVPWEGVASGRVDARRQVVELVRERGEPIAIGPVRDPANAASYAVPERFAELVELLSRVLDVRDISASSDRSGALRMFVSGLVLSAMGLGLHFINMVVAARFGLAYENLYIPILLGVVGIILVVLAVQRHSGRSVPDEPAKPVDVPKLFGALGLFVVLDLVLQFLSSARHSLLH